MTHRELVPIPPIETATDPIHSPADMRQRWRALMGPLGFGERLLRFSFVGPDRRMVKVLGEVPIDLSLREGGDSGVPIVEGHPDSVAATALTGVATTLSGRGRGLAGLQLGLSPAGRL